MKTLLVSWVVALLCLRTCAAISDSLTVSVTGGYIQGKFSGRGTINFLGIPYGTAQRFQVPTGSLSPWAGVRNATVPGPQCPQNCPPVIRDLYCLPDNQMSESCLSLNIYRPAYNLPAGQAFPVMVFIHGGGFESGSGAAPLLNGDYLARVGGVIVVTFNYRLGALGFLPIFNDYDDVISNFGLRDQQVALRWIQQNIARFDGDPNKVTLSGAEAGCQSVVLHLTSQTSDPLFHSAILHSCPFNVPFRSKNESRQIAQDFASALGCAVNDVDCLRQRTAQDILLAQVKVTDKVSSSSPSLRRFEVWGPVVDKRSVYDSSLLDEVLNANLRSWTGGKDKPLIIGVVAEEGEASVYRNYPLPVSESFFQRLVEAELPGDWRKVAENRGAPYRPANSADAREEMSRFLNDFVYACPARRVAQSLGGPGQRNVWMYVFNPQVTLSPGGSAWPPGGEPYCQDKACQGLDLMYLFNSPNGIPDSRRALTEDLSQAMATYWSNFAKFFNPNGPQLTSPPTFGAFSSGLTQTSTSLTRGSLSRTTTTLDKLPPYLLRLMNSPANSASGDRTALPQFSLWSPAFLSPAQPVSSVLGTTSVGASGLTYPGLSARQQGTAIIDPNSPLTAFQGQFRRPSPSGGAPPATSAFVVDWPVTSFGDAILLLTQPTAVVRQSLLASACGFWDGLL